MPMYDYKCGCGRQFMFFSNIVEYQRQRACPDCGKMADRHITQAPAVKGDYPGYRCPITDEWVEGRRAHEENLKRHGCRVLEPGETEQFKKRKVAEEAAFDASIEATAEEFVVGLDSKKREQLAAELDNGADTTVVRQ